MVRLLAMNTVPTELDELPYLVGRAWRLGDSVGAEQILAPAHHDAGLAAGSVALRGITPVPRLECGDFLVAGHDFGAGAATRATARALRLAGVAGVIARSFGATFLRCAVHVGLPALQVEETPAVKTGDRLRVDIEGHKVVNLSSGDRYVIRNVYGEALDVLRAGGWTEYTAWLRGRK
jgi:3-isopropylmalate/(R)-2-methylmalate dehydratase small subunit